MRKARTYKFSEKTIDRIEDLKEKHETWNSTAMVESAIKEKHERDCTE